MTSESKDMISRIEAHFHEVILSRAAKLVAEHSLVLPGLKADRPSREDPRWFPVPGMAGGFNYWFEDDGRQLVCESWCRVVGGSGQRHEVTEHGWELVDSGFV